MNANSGRLFDKIFFILGLASATLLTIPLSQAQNSGDRSVNPRPSISQEPSSNPDGKSTTPTTKILSTLETPTTGKNLVALAEANGSLKTLVKALKAAGLTETLQGNALFTIFAPTDAAFAELPQEALQDLLKPENKKLLGKILTYHVVSGKVLSKDLKAGAVKSLEGSSIDVKIDPASGVAINDAKVTQADIIGTNGVIHQIDRVILPPDL